VSVLVEDAAESIASSDVEAVEQFRCCDRLYVFQLEVVTGLGGSHGPVVNSCWSTSSRSMPCLVAVDR